MSDQTSAKSALANLPEITEICRYALFTDYVELAYAEKEAALSIMLVAPPEEGKTAVVDQFDENRGILYMDNTTAWGLEHKYLEQLKSGAIKRVLIPDFIDPTNRKKVTVDSTIVFFNKYISWEGLREVQTYKMSFSLREPLRGSLLTTMALDDFLRMVKSLAAVGFLSRLMIVGYKYSDKQLDVLLEDIIYKRASWGKIKLPLPDGKIPVKLDPDLAIKMKPLARTLGLRVGGQGIRASHQLEVMAKGKALSDLRDEVIEDDIFRVMYLAERYVNNISLRPEVKAYISKKEQELTEAEG